MRPRVMLYFFGNPSQNNSTIVLTSDPGRIGGGGELDAGYQNSLMTNCDFVNRSDITGGDVSRFELSTFHDDWILWLQYRPEPERDVVLLLTASSA
jgi:hypothetical protein